MADVTLWEAQTALRFWRKHLYDCAVNFIGLPGLQTVPPFVPSLLVEFRKRLNEDILSEINEMIIAYNTPDDPISGGGNQTDQAQTDTDENAGTMILDASCAPQNILNEAREDLEAIIDDICDRFYYYKPRKYREKARKVYLKLAKCKKRTAKKFVQRSRSSCRTSGVIGDISMNS